MSSPKTRRSPSPGRKPREKPKDKTAEIGDKLLESIKNKDIGRIEDILTEEFGSRQGVNLDSPELTKVNKYIVKTQSDILADLAESSDAAIAQNNELVLEYVILFESDYAVSKPYIGSTFVKLVKNKNNLYKVILDTNILKPNSILAGLKETIPRIEGYDPAWLEITRDLGDYLANYKQ